ncbi:MAG TPA: SdpI family protein [Ktedonobacteraceae bacterium]|nr:SdpI family protein [Ktedonobacteraceae bacterium]
MSSSEDTGDKVIPSRHPITSMSPAELLAVMIIIVQILVSIVSYPFLPDSVPSHWDASGQVNGYLPKLVNALLYPLLSIGIYALVRVLMTVGPRLGYQNQRKASVGVVNLILVGVLLFMLIVQLTTTAVALGASIDVTFVICLSISVLFIFLGNYMGKLRRNFWAGIRTPWTLTSDVVWERTHRLGGWLFVLAGLLGVVLSFIPALRLWGLMVVIFIVVIVLFVYSYVIYQHLTVEGKEPLSPPFDSDDRA